MSRPGRPHLWAAIALASTRAALAAPDPPATALVVIVAPAPLGGLGIERRLQATPPQTADSEQLRAAGALNLADYMARNLSGVNVGEISGSPFQNDIAYRGFRASPVLGSAQGISVYLDGVRVNEPFGDVVNWDMLPEAAIARLALVPGSNPLYGLNTLGGALVLTSKSGRDDPGLDATVSASAGGRRRADLTQGWRNGNGWHALAAFTLFDDAGWRAHSASALGNGYVKLGQVRGDTSWSAALLGGRSRLGGNGLLPSYRESERGLVPGLYEQDRRAAYTFPDTTRNALVQLTLNVTQQFDARTALSATAYLRRSRRDTVTGDLAGDYVDYVSECAACTAQAAPPAASLNTSSTGQRSHGASANLAMRRGGQHIDAGFSADASSVDFAQFEQDGFFTGAREARPDPEAPRRAGSAVTGSARTIGVYAADTFSAGASTHITASARWNHAAVANTLATPEGAQAPERFVYRRLNPALALVRELGGGAILSASVAQGNRVPTVIELGCADPDRPCRLPAGLQSDPYLRQVRSTTVEVGARWGGARLALFRTINRDDILFLAAGTTHQGYFSNFPRTRHQGAEAGVQKRFGRFGIDLAYHYLRAVYDADGQLFTGARTLAIARGARMAGLPSHTVKLGLTWQESPALRLGLDAQALSSLVVQGNEDGALDWRVAGHATVNARLAWQPASAWEWSAQVGNLFDRRYESYGALAPDMFPNGRLLGPGQQAGQPALARFVAPGAGRSLTLALRYHF